MEKENPFKAVGATDHNLPEHVKKNVMRDVHTAKSLMEMSCAFTQKYKEAMASLLKTRKKRDKG